MPLQRLASMRLRPDIVENRRDGREAHSRTQPQGLAPLIDWMSFYAPFWSDRFTRLESLLKRMDP